ncbi:MAG: ECF transporter S component [Clostridia bacterium]|nr:ECF transporter S component [Clostridia bacterium]
MSKSSAMKRNLALAQLGMLSALIVIMTFVPYIGYISIGALSITLLHIPLIIGACVLGVKGGLVLGAVWGITCIIKAATSPVAITDPLFTNPLVSLLPRLIAGLVAGLVFEFVSKKFKKFHLASVLSAVFACLTNTVFVMGSLYLVYGQSSEAAKLGIVQFDFGSFIYFILGAFGTNAVFEMIIAIVIAVPISHALRKAKIKF